MVLPTLTLKPELALVVLDLITSYLRADQDIHRLREHLSEQRPSPLVSLGSGAAQRLAAFPT